MQQKTLEIVAGPNGSGKSTFAESYFLNVRKDIPYLNPDLIAAGMASSKDFEGASFQAGRILINEIWQRLNKGESFAFESTLSGKNWLALIQEAKTKGYKVIIYFIFLSSVSQNIKRISERVSMGGHHIAPEVVKRRHPRCFSNFLNLYAPLADNWMIFDNSTKKPKKILDIFDYSEISGPQKSKFMKHFLKGDLNGVKKTLNSR